MAVTLPDYAAERARAEEQAAASRQITQLFPQGHSTPDHYFWGIVTEEGASIVSFQVFHNAA